MVSSCGNFIAKKALAELQRFHHLIGNQLKTDLVSRYIFYLFVVDTGKGSALAFGWLAGRRCFQSAHHRSLHIVAGHA
jgi:hypothetical protein